MPLDEKQPLKDFPELPLKNLLINYIFICSSMKKNVKNDVHNSTFFDFVK